MLLDDFRVWVVAERFTDTATLRLIQKLEFIAQGTYEIVVVIGHLVDEVVLLLLIFLRYCIDIQLFVKDKRALFTCKRHLLEVICHVVDEHKLCIVMTAVRML